MASSKKRVTFQFKTLKDLKLFAETMQTNYVKINIRTLTLICECNEKEMAAALEGFDAKIIG